jgi:hypothetical protein
MACRSELRSRRFVAGAGLLLALCCSSIAFGQTPKLAPPVVTRPPPQHPQTAPKSTALPNKAVAPRPASPATPDKSDQILKAKELVIATATMWATIGQTIVGLFGLIGLWLTVRSATGAWEESGRAAKAAEASLAHAKNVDEIDLRPWLRWKVEAKNFQAEPDGCRVTLEFSVSNVGKTPAYNLLIHAQNVSMTLSNPEDRKSVGIPSDIEVAAFFDAKSNNTNGEIVLPGDEISLSIWEHFKFTNALDVDGINLRVGSIAIRVTYAFTPEGTPHHNSRCYFLSTHSAAPNALQLSSVSGGWVT